MATEAKRKSKRPQSLAVKPQMAAASRSNRDLSFLKATKMMNTKAALPAEIMAMVLDFLPVPDLLHVARTSKRMQEMVNDDTRWVLKLREMGVWNEAEARQKTDAAIKRKMEGHLKKDSSGLKNGSGHAAIHGVQGQTARRRSSAAPVGDLIDPGEFTEQVTSEQGPTTAKPPTNAASGTKTVILDAPATAPLPAHLASKLSVIERVQSIRGGARQEYSKLYSALCPYYTNVVSSPATSTPQIYRDFTDPQHQARILSELTIFAKSDTTSGWQQRVEALDNMACGFEARHLRAFEQAHAPITQEKVMLWIARAMVTLNGGKAAMASFITNNNLLARKDLLGNPIDCLEHAFPGQANLNPSRDFFQRLSTATQEQIELCDLVFPYPTNNEVTELFLDAVGTDVINPYIESLFREAYAAGHKEACLKIVSGVYEHCQQFFASIKPGADGQHEDLKEMTDNILQRLFSPHFRQFMEEEQAFYEERAIAEVKKWEQQLSEQEASAENFFMSNVNRQKDKRDFMTSFKKVLMAPVNVLPSLTANKTPKPAGIAARPASRPGTPEPSTLGEGSGSNRRSVSPLPASRVAPTTELEAKAALMNSRLEGISALFSIEVALSMVHLTRSSIERISPFVTLPALEGPQARNKCEELFLRLLDILGNRHVIGGFDKAIQHLSTYSARQVTVHNTDEGVKPLVTFVELINVGDLIQQMIDVFYNQELCAHNLTDKDDFMNPATKEKKRFEQELDKCVANGLERGIDVLADEIEYTLATTQAPTDYNPAGVVATAKNPRPVTPVNILESDVGATATAQRVVDLARGHVNMLRGTTDAGLLEAFNHEVGLRLFAALCKHVKRSRISQEGALRLISDTALYYDFAVTIRVRDLLPRYRALREVAQLFLVDGGNGKEIAAMIADREKYGGVFRPEDVKEFAERRADWLGIKGSVEAAYSGQGCGVM